MTKTKTPVFVAIGRTLTYSRLAKLVKLAKLATGITTQRGRAAAVWAEAEATRVPADALTWRAPLLALAPGCGRRPATRIVPEVAVDLADRAAHAGGRAGLGAGSRAASRPRWPAAGRP